MQVIRKPFDRVSKLWPKPRGMLHDVRLIRYVLREPVPEGELLHHTLTGKLVLLTPEESEALNRLPGVMSEELKPFVEDHFVVPADFDEQAALEQLRNVLRLTDPTGIIRGYTILPTTHCNARCFYCFENNVEHKHMTMETADETVQFIKDHHGGQNISISWFGGEPLVGWKIIDRICEGLKENSISFRSDMVTNGYLFDQAMISHARELWELKDVQITLDGTREVYNGIKRYVSVSDDPYLRVISNIDELLRQGIHVAIRLNMDKHNHENLTQLVDELAEHFSGCENLNVYCAVLFNNCGSEPIPRTDEDDAMLLSWKYALDRRISMAGLASGHPKLPQIVYCYCKADSDNTAIILPDGSLGKCEHFVDEALGNLRTGWTDAETIQAYKVPLAQAKCAQCELEPFCYQLKRCETDHSCSKYRVEELMSASHMAMLEAYRNGKQADDENAADRAP